MSTETATQNRQVVQHSTGVPREVARVEIVDVPTPGPGELLVELVLAPINPAEVLMFEGEYGYRETVPELPRHAGIEGVGRVVDGAPDALASVPLGSLVSLAGASPVFADYRVMPAASTLVIPDGVDHESVAVTFVNAQAVLMMLAESPELAPGDWIIQNAGNSGYGRILDAIATREGYRVVNVVRSAASAATIAAPLGPVVVDEGAGGDPSALESRVLEATGGIRPRVAIDAIGGEATNALAHTLEPGGRVVTYGLMSGDDCRIDARLIVFGGIRLEGFWMPRSFPTLGAARMADIAAKAFDYVKQGGIDVPIEARYGLDDIGTALEHASRPHRSGKVVVTR